MVKYSLLEAKHISNSLFELGMISELKRVSRNAFEIESQYIPEPVKRAQSLAFDIGWIDRVKGMKLKLYIFIGFLTVIVSVAAISVFHNQSVETVDTTEKSTKVSNLKPLDFAGLPSDELQSLVAQGRIDYRSNHFVLTKQIELGGFLAIEVNQTFKDSTLQLSGQLIKNGNLWQIERWVRVE